MFGGEGESERGKGRLYISGGGEREREKGMNSIFEGSGSRVLNAWVKSKKETQLSLRDCFTRQDKRLLCSLLSPRQAKT